MNPRKFYQVACANCTLELGRRTFIMGIVNVTPDSFSDGGKFYATDAALARGEKLAADGADIIDVGGESTRPFSEAVPVEEEIRRVVTVIEKLAPRVSVPISIDTNKAAVARRAMEAGASLINDISALRFDPGIAAVAVEYDAPVIMMHMLGNPRTMQVLPRYDHLIAEIRQFLADALERAEKLGVSRSKIILDPGIGFGKTVEHNLLLIKHLREFSSLDAPILIGTSRKAFIRKILQEAHAEELRPELPIVETGTQASLAAAVINGAHIVRVHNVANTRATVKILDALINAQP
jgi:dihydropteroate synthase